MAQVVTAIAGSSAWFERGFVTYSNAAKEEMLGVRAETLARHGAVSERDRAGDGARARWRTATASVALAVTGIAGPSGGSAGKAGRHGVLRLGCRRAAPRARETRRFPGDREAVRRQSVERALQGVLEAP